MSRIKLLFSLTLLFILLSLLFVQKTLAAELTGSWAPTTSLPQNRASLVSFGQDGRLYIFGGANTDDFSSVLSSQKNANGTINTWGIISDLPETRYWAAQVQAGNRIYILGGAKFDGSETHKNTVYSAEVLNDGTIPSWQTYNGIPASLSLGAAAIVGDRIYFSGGFGPGYSNKVYSAPINPDGSLGTWVVSGEMPEARIGHGMIEHNGHLIILGGSTLDIQNLNTETPLSTVYMATPDSNGNISSWQQLNSLPGGVYRGGWVKDGDKIISVGGNNGAVSTDKVFYTTVNDDGTVNAWQESANHLPNEVQGGSAVILGNYLYYIGGYRTQSGSYLDSVFFTKLNLETDLDVPLLKQTDPAWGLLEYDSAKSWYPTNPTISRWGCAITSAVMVFNYHGITKLPDGSTLDPKNLNTWLKNNKGYINGGVTSWARLADLSKLAKSKNPSFNFDALELQILDGYNPTQLKSDLEKNIPDILEVDNGQHFIVAKGTSGSTFKINDPFYNVSSLNQAHNNTFSFIKRFTPSNSDLSFIELASDKEVDFSVKNENGDLIGVGETQNSYYIDGEPAFNLPTYLYSVSKPDNGKYKVLVNSKKQEMYDMTIRLHDEDGNLVEKIIKGVVQPGNSDEFTINFNKSSNSDSNIVQNVSFDGLIADLDYFYSKKLITNLGVYKALKSKAQQAKNYSTSNKKTAKNIMASFISQLNANKNKTVKIEAYNILKPQADSLYNSL